MKTLLILALLLILVGGAWLSRPSERSFRDYVSARMTQDQDNLLGKTIATVAADRYLDGVTYNNRFVYATITRADRVEYVGAFARWFRWADGELTISSAR